MGIPVNGRAYPMQTARKAATLTACLLAAIGGAALLVGDFGLSDKTRALLFGSLTMSIVAITSTIGLIEKLSTKTYVDGSGVRHRAEDSVTYWYLVAFNVFGILAFIGVAALAVFHFT